MLQRTCSCSGWKSWSWSTRNARFLTIRGDRSHLSDAAQSIALIHIGTISYQHFSARSAGAVVECPRSRGRSSEQAWVTERAVVLPSGAKGSAAMATVLPFFQDVAFDLDLTQAMGEAFERACRSLHDVGQPDIVKEVIARRIIEVAKTGERDPERLSDHALLALGVSRINGAA